MRSTSLLLCRLGYVSFLLTTSVTMAQSTPASPTLKSVLLEQLRTTHHQEDWFVPVKLAIEGGQRRKVSRDAGTASVAYGMFQELLRKLLQEGERNDAFATASTDSHRLRRLPNYSEFKSDPKICGNLRNLWT